jgi:hypothetical protein
VQALLENPFTEFVYFYKNLNASFTADEDDAYHVFARRCRSAGVLTEDCAEPDIVFDHLVFTRTRTTDGFYRFDVVALTAENPVGAVLGSVAPVNPFGLPNAPGPVTVLDAADPRRDPSALSDLAAELGAGSRSVVETEPSTEVGIERWFTPAENATYPYPYERFAAEMDDADSADLMVVPTPSGDEGDVRGGHGSPDITQSRATLMVSGRGARRAPLDPLLEQALEIKHVDIAPTVASVLGVRANSVGRYLNNGTAVDNPDAEPALLLRQDGKVLHDLLEPKVNTFVVVIDEGVDLGLEQVEAQGLVAHAAEHLGEVPRLVREVRGLRRLRRAGDLRAWRAQRGRCPRAPDAAGADGLRGEGRAGRARRGGVSAIVGRHMAADKQATLQAREP